MATHLSIIAGLGNPEERYARTLHNAGFWFADAIAAKAGAHFRFDKKFDAELCKIDLGGGDVWLVKPQSYMNLSGGPIRAVLDYYRLSVGNLLVAHDEIDLPPGVARLKKGGGHGGHNGIRDTIRHCGNDFMRLRLGVGHPGTKEQVTGYVLKPGSAEVEEAVINAIDEAVAVLPQLVDKGLGIAMNRLHTRAAADAGNDPESKDGKTGNGD
ncbi:MAG: aminoacyl-tRNA hydrolase [Woeseia sp.]